MDNGKIEIITIKIKVFGIVQGVGFRPLVYRIAQKYEINGTVRNVGGYVEIIAQGKLEYLDLFLKQLKDCKSEGCEIIKIEEEKIDSFKYENFIIIKSKESNEVSIIPPDLPVCGKCQEELYMISDRRYQNPFISCMSCGPRYTIIDSLPYDRVNTTMKDYTMCPSCHEEYVSPDSRRFHAQTISCNDCGPYLIFDDLSEIKKDIASDQVNIDKETLDKETLDKVNSFKVTSGKVTSDFSQDNNENIKTKSHIKENELAFEQAVKIIQKGGILAVKGIGGYHLVCSPFMEEAVVHLRNLKGREEKPFAVMFPDMKDIEKICVVSKEERALLQTIARPIVLLYMHQDTFATSVNKGSIYCGAFLPYTPLQIMLTRRCGPLIMTSANLSEQPIIKDDDKIKTIDSPYLDGILYNERRIVRSVDDSVAKIIDGKPQLIRRSRGYVPYPVFINQECINGNRNNNLKHPMIFAAGGDLKAAFCLYRNESAVLSQYFGDLEEVSILAEYRKSYQDLSSLIKINPTIAACDLHPNYHSVQFAKSLGIPVIQVQHHHAHIASVMAEHDLKGPVIGISFDGTGYGTDGAVWGGEFLVCEGAEFIRAAHLKLTSMLGGDQSMRDAKKTASCYLIHSELSEYVRDERAPIIQAALQKKINTINSSSMGRLFDTVASLLDIGQENHYEGECAALLEKEAVLAQRSGIQPIKLSFAISEKGEIIELNPKPVLEELCRLREQEETKALALGFHYALADAAGEICEKLRTKYHSNTVAISGGVFQNTVLTQQLLNVLRQNNFEVYGNMAVPPNDGGISLGQTYVALNKYSNEITNKIIATPQNTNQTQSTESQEPLKELS